MSYKDLKFECRGCDDNKLEYHKYARCTTPVSLQKNGHIEYGQSIIDEDDYLATLNGFACGACGSLIEHCGIRLETEKQLIDYLTMDTDLREKEPAELVMHNNEITDLSEDK